MCIILNATSDTTPTKNYCSFNYHTCYHRLAIEIGRWLAISTLWQVYSYDIVICNILDQTPIELAQTRVWGLMHKVAQVF